MLSKERQLLTLCIFIFLMFSTCSANDSKRNSILLVEKQISSPESRYEIYSVDQTGEYLKKLTEFSRKNVYWLSPNGRHIALLTPWEDDGPERPKHALTIIDLFTDVSIDQIADVGRYNPERDWAFVSDDSIVWSPKGDKLVFERNSAGGQGVDLWVYDLQDASITPLTQSEAIDWHPAWSPDEERIAFTSRKPCGKAIGECSPMEEYWDIVVINAEGYDKQTIVDFRKTDFFVNEHYTVKVLCNLNWSPNGDFIAFENRCLSGRNDAPHHVFISDLDGGRTDFVTKFPEFPDSSIINYNYWFTWSQTGDKLYIGYSKDDLLDTSLSLAGGFLIVDVDTFESINSPEIYGLRTRRNWSSDTAFFTGSTTRIKNDRFAPGPTLLGKLNNIGDFTILTISDKLPFGSCDEPAVHWSPNDLYIAYAIGQKFGDCFEESVRREIVIVDIDNGQIINVPLKGDIRPIGWAVEEPE